MSSQQLIQKVATLDVKRVQLVELKKPKSAGAVYVPIRYKLENGSYDKLYVQTPKMWTPFGAQCFKKEEVIASGKLPKFTVQVSLDDKDDAKIGVLRKFFEELDEKICETISQSKVWLDLLGVKTTNKKNKKKTEEELYNEVEGKYTPIIPEVKPAKDGKMYPPSLKVKVMTDFKTGDITTKCSSRKKFVDLTYDNIEEVLAKFTTLKMLISVSHLWVISGRVGVALKLVHANTFPKTTVAKLELLDDEDDEDDEEEEEAETAEEEEVEEEEEEEVESEDDE